MKNYQFIEKSRFYQGEYVLYDPTCDGRVARVYKEGKQFRVMMGNQVFRGTLTELDKAAKMLSSEKP